MQIQGWLIAVLISAMCAFSMLMAYTSMSADYGITQLDSTYTETFNKMNETDTITTDMANIAKQVDLKDKDLITASIDLTSAGFQIAWGGIKLVFNSISIMHSLIIDSAEVVGIPYYITNTLIAIVFIIIVSMIISYLGKWAVNE